MKKQRIFIIATIFATLFIFGNSAMPANISDIGSDSVINLFNLPSEAVAIVRKTAHILEFALQGFLLFGCFSGKFNKRIIYVLFFGLMTACIDEFIQLFPEGRASMIQDVFIDFAGINLGLLLSFALNKIRRKRSL